MILAALLLQAAAAPTVPWAVQTRATGKNIATSSSAWSTDNSARLVLRCDATAEKIVSLQFIPKTGFAATLPRPVSINIDDNGWLGTNWQFPGNGAYISDDLVVSNLAAMIAHGKAIHLRVINPDNKAIDAVFAGPGEAPIRQVLAACGYEFGKPPTRTGTPALPSASAKTQSDPDDQ